MRTSVLIAAAAVAAISACSQSRAEDGGPMVRRNFAVGNFDRIEVAGPYDVRVRTGSAPGVSGSGPEKLMDRLVVEVKGDRLLIHPQRERFSGWSSIRGKAVLDVTVPELREAAIAGSGGIAIDSIRGSRFDGSVGGSGDLTVDRLAVQALSLSIGGSGDIRVRSGEARNVSYSIADSGGIDAADIRSDTAKLSIAGSGNIQGQASGTADVNIMGSGDVVMTGGARCNVSKMGSGSARCS